MIVELFKLIPLIVRVDIESGEVVRAIVLDESAVDYDWDRGMSVVERVTPDSLWPTWGPPTDDEHDAAAAIADAGDTEWPAWQFGA